MTTRVRAIGLVGLTVAAAAAAGLWTPRASAQLARPGEDPRPAATRIVEPLPLPVTGDVRVTGEVRVEASRPLLVQVANPASAAPPFVEPGRCYFIDLTGGPTWRDALWRIEGIQGLWIQVRHARAATGAAAAETTWVNTASVSRMSDAMPCE